MFGFTCVSCVCPLCPWTFTPSVCVIIVPFICRTHTHRYRRVNSNISHGYHLALSLSLGPEGGTTLNWFYFIPNCFLPEDYCKAICAEQRETQWTCGRHLVSFVSLDLFAVSVIDLRLYKGRNEWTQNAVLFCFLTSTVRVFMLLTRLFIKHIRSINPHFSAKRERLWRIELFK